MLLVLRDPIDRLETSFWAHPQYPKRYGASPEGIHAYVVEQASRFTYMYMCMHMHMCMHMSCTPDY